MDELRSAQTCSARQLARAPPRVAEQVAEAAHTTAGSRAAVLIECADGLNAAQQGEPSLQLLHVDRGAGERRAARIGRVDQDPNERKYAVVLTERRWPAACAAAAAARLPRSRRSR